MGEESGNDLIAEVSSLPWLQDTAEVDAWGLWDATWRDVYVLDGDNMVVGVINLTEHDLADDANKDALRALLDQAGARQP
ncbi:MAG: hypothetical protein D6798_20585 [Deltaproteobacteria bacterium]|nr:MAG: hypothetical protein D6798_20585 [Deltaproteobacteria bacterium]